MRCISFSITLRWYQRINSPVFLFIPADQLPWAWDAYRFLIIFAGSSVSIWWLSFWYRRINYLEHEIDVNPFLLIFADTSVSTCLFFFWYRRINCLEHEMYVYQYLLIFADTSVSTWFFYFIPSKNLTPAWHVYRFLLLFADNISAWWFFFRYRRIKWLEHEMCIVFCLSPLIAAYQLDGFSVDIGASTAWSMNEMCSVSY